jgi:hypothetical protein
MRDKQHYRLAGQDKHQKTAVIVTCVPIALSFLVTFLTPSSSVPETNYNPTTPEQQSDISQSTQAALPEGSCSNGYVPSKDWQFCADGLTIDDGWFLYTDKSAIQGEVKNNNDYYIVQDIWIEFAALDKDGKKIEKTPSQLGFSLSRNW